MRLFTELRYSAAAEGKIFAALLNSSRANAVADSIILRAHSNLVLAISKGSLVTTASAPIAP